MNVVACGFPPGKDTHFQAHAPGKERNAYP